MGQTNGGESAEKEPDAAQQLRDEIEHTRGALGETVEQLSAKADVKSRARAQAAAAAGRVKDAAAKAGEQAATGVETVSNGASKQWVPLSAVGGAVLAVAALVIWRRRRLWSSWTGLLRREPHRTGERR
jgi:hypothetical protein